MSNQLFFQNIDRSPTFQYMAFNSVTDKLRENGYLNLYALPENFVKEIVKSCLVTLSSIFVCFSAGTYIGSLFLKGSVILLVPNAVLVGVIVALVFSFAIRSEGPNANDIDDLDRVFADERELYRIERGYYPGEFCEPGDVPPAFLLKNT